MHLIHLYIFSPKLAVYEKMSLARCESMKGRKDEEERRRGGALSLYKYPNE